MMATPTTTPETSIERATKCDRLWWMRTEGLMGERRLERGRSFEHCLQLDMLSAQRRWRRCAHSPTRDQQPPALRPEA